MTAAAAPRLKILDWRPIAKNTLRGFAKIRLPNGLTRAGGDDAS